jgi:hypothetical protein
MRSSLMAGLSAVTFVLAACGGKGDSSVEKPVTGGSTTAPAPTGGEIATTIHLVVSGGPHAGTYDAQSGEITCTYGFAGPGSWGNQYSVAGKKGNEFSSLQLIVPDTKDAADGSDKFLLTAGFGEPMKPGSAEYTINTGGGDQNKAGSGVVTVDDKGKSGTVTFKGQTKDGVTLEGTIDCRQMMRG